MPAIIFDMDDTLYNLCDPFEEAFRKVFPELKDKDATPFFQAHRRRSDEVFEASRNGDISMEEMYIYRIQKAMEDFGVMIDKSTSLTFQTEYEKAQKNIRMTGIVEGLLEFLKSNKIQTGIITNGPEMHQWNKIVTLGADRWISRDEAIISEAAGAAKPDKRIFAYAEQQLKIRGEDSYYIGDSFENDVIGAKRAGWNSIWLNRRGKDMPCVGIRPDYIVSDEEQMAELVRNIIQTALLPLP